MLNFMFSCIVIESSFDPGERLQTPGSLWFQNQCTLWTPPRSFRGEIITIAKKHWQIELLWLLLINFPVGINVFLYYNGPTDPLHISCICSIWKIFHFYSSFSLNPSKSTFFHALTLSLPTCCLLFLNSVHAQDGFI